jgi:hypothetical protein
MVFFFEKWLKCFRPLPKKFGHQLSVTIVNDQNFPIAQFGDQKFSITQVNNYFFLGINKKNDSIVGSMVIVD